MFVFCFAIFQEIARRTTTHSHGLCSSTRHKRSDCFRQSRARTSEQEARFGPAKLSHDPSAPQWPMVVDTHYGLSSVVIIRFLPSNSVAALNLRYLLFFGSGEIFDLFGFSVGELFEFFEGALVLVLADFLVFFELVDGFFDVPADVADGGTVVFERLVDLLDELLAPFAGGRGNRNAHDLAVGVGIEAEVGGANGLVNQWHGAGVPGRDQQGAGVGNGDVA